MSQFKMIDLRMTEKHKLRHTEVEFGMTLPQPRDHSSLNDMRVGSFRTWSSCSHGEIYP